MTQVQKWKCFSEESFGVECETVFYVEGEYGIKPNCPECGDDKHTKSQGFKEVTDIIE